MNVDHDFQIWNKDRLEVTLGPNQSNVGSQGSVQQVGVQGTASTAAGAATLLSLQHSTGILQQMHQSSTTGGGGGGCIAGTNPTSKSQKKLDEWNVAAINRGCHAKSLS